MTLYKTVKKVRVVSSVTIFFFILFLFIDFKNSIPAALGNYIAATQFLPALLHTLTGLSIISVFLFALLIITLTVGRVYCSFLCPLGTMQDLLIRGFNKFKLPRKFSFKEDRYQIRYAILFAGFLGFLLGTTAVLVLFDPFSSFGRMVVVFIGAPYSFISENVGYIFSRSELGVMITDSRRLPGIALLVTTIILFLKIVLYTRKDGRDYCNELCPVGAMLGLLSRISLYRFRIDVTTCDSCGACGKMCKAGCIDTKAKHIDYERCIGCFNCTLVCPTGSISLGRVNTNKIAKAKGDGGRRAFLRRGVLSFFVFSIPGFVQQKIIPKKFSTVFVQRKNPIVPPGGKSREDFNAKCTTCNLCVAQCPTRVLQPAVLEYGVLGFLQPHLTNEKGFCNFECVRCSEVCPTGALQKLLPAEKKLTQLGKVHFIKENCIVETEKTDCGACSEHCPTKAVYMVPYGKLMLPEVENKFCIGCGACEFACPTKPYKAIYVEGNEVHLVAEKKVEEKLPQQTNFKEEFPF